jgi:hypothetical protein
METESSARRPELAPASIASAIAPIKVFLEMLGKIGDRLS